ncbi:class II aldolase/adducin family protein [Nonomuraea sp. NPDC049480]|uniref:class II aldolase/adducin family protein n=1 Tax=Nonomuraea sp. NPDC049480 TaxID=3364353 RepID=UPI00379F0DE8
MSLAQLSKELTAAGHALARAGLVTAFGHVSTRLDADRLLITPPRPLGELTPDRHLELDLNVSELPGGVPREAWIHIAIARARPDVGAICRAQPPSASPLAATLGSPAPLHGQGALLGPVVPVFPNARLIREPQLGKELAATLGDGFACMLKGNGAVTVGGTIGEAVARMWILEESCRLALAAAAAGVTPATLTEAERNAWAATGPELLERIWDFLK